jgi:predicted transcriptional regulator
MSESSKKLLSMLLVMGAQVPERALSASELAQKLGTDQTSVESDLRKLLETSFVATSVVSGGRGFYLTGIGVIAASSTYS